MVRLVAYAPQRLTRLVCCLVGVATVAACGWSVDATPPRVSSTHSTIVSPQFVVGVPDEHAGLLGDRRFTDNDIGPLVSPHVLLRQQSTGVATEIGPGAAEKLGLSGAIKAPPGHEFVIADFTENVGYQQRLPKHGKQPGSLDGTTYRLAVQVGKVKRPLYFNVAPGTLLIVCAPTHARVRLVVADGRRTQALNLRTGRRVKDGISSYYPTQDWSPRHPKRGWQAKGLTRAGPLVTEIAAVHAYLSPFAPTGRWARRDKAWLYVTEHLVTGCGNHIARCRVRLSPSRRLRLHVRGSHDRKPVGSAFSSTAWPTNQHGTVTVGFQVPVSLRSATLVTSTAGQVRIKRRLGKRTTHTTWRKKPPTVRVRLKPRR